MTPAKWSEPSVRPTTSESDAAKAWIEAEEAAYAQQAEATAKAMAAEVERLLYRPDGTPYVSDANGFYPRPHDLGAERPALLAPFTERDLDLGGMHERLDQRDERRVMPLLGRLDRDHDEKHAEARHPFCPGCFGAPAEAYLRTWLVLNPGRKPEDGTPPKGRDEVKYLTISELAELETPPAFVDRVIPRGSNVILRGRDHSFKSFVALDWALHVATGRSWHEHDVEQGRVLYLAAEGASGVKRRIDAWQTFHGVTVPDKAFTLVTAPINFYAPGREYERLLEATERGSYGLVCIDTIRKVSGNADENSSAMGVVIDNIDRVKRATADGSTLSVAHTQRADSDVRGFSGIEDDVDVVWAAERDSQNGPCVALKQTKMKDGIEHAAVTLESRSILLGHRHTRSGTEEPITSLVFTTAGGQHIVNPAMAKEAQILDFLRRGTDAPEGLAMIHKGTGLSKTTAKDRLDAMVEKGDVRNVHEGTNKRPAYVAVKRDDI